MQDTGHTNTPDTAQPAGPEAKQRSPEAAAALEAVRDALTAKRRGEARERATAALEQYGPDPDLYALLGRAHVAEDEDDHDDEAERVYRRGLDVFPDHLDLLAAYAELCRAADGLERPGRAARAAQLIARIEELAPGSPQAQRLRDPVPLWAAQGQAPQPSPTHTQRHDVRQALATAPGLAEAARLAEEEAGQHPHSLRLAIRAETLTAFTRPGRPLLLWLIRAPCLSVLAVLAAGALTLLLDASARWSVWAAAGAVLALLPYRLLTVLESGARIRATDRVLPLPANTPEPPSPLSPPAAPGLRDFAVLGAALTLAVFALVSPMALKSLPAEPEDYPHYTVAPPQEFRGEPLASAVPVVAGVGSDLASLWTESLDVEGAFAYLYGDLSVLGNMSGPDAIIVGATGDFRGTPDEALKGYELGLSESDSTINEIWQPDAGPGGGRLRCVSYADDREAPGARVACSWVDDGSYGTVVMNERLDHDAAAEAARTARDAVLHGGVRIRGVSALSVGEPWSQAGDGDQGPVVTGSS
ncbi:iron-containing alcohol dehydrogenase [Streptomyces sp. 130]|uniref:iron-containing alcohol dehydrogenase n=1 Tax=Streptomyces sp. 130 TaxID=2591006 RepID=UPI00117D0DE0|nr:iron-containing alcohol dehydrogenase [Streptomyces sp. 130]TRV80938.1 iron-containing alcohol dehydrogenase [Streptomyces sp. 130]